MSFGSYWYGLSLTRGLLNGTLNSGVLALTCSASSEDLEHSSLDEGIGFKIFGF